MVDKASTFFSLKRTDMKVFSHEDTNKGKFKIYCATCPNKMI